MKKILMTLALALTTMCANAKGAKTPVFAWSGWGENTTEKSLTADFKAWKKHGVTGVCINAGMDVEKIAVAAKVAKGGIGVSCLGTHNGAGRKAQELVHREPPRRVGI